MKLALSTSGRNISRQTFEAYKAAEIEAMEISEGRKINADAIDFPMIRALSDEYGVKLWSFHLPFGPFDEIDISQPSLAEYTVKYFCSLIDKATAVGIHTLVIHPSGEPIAEEDRPLRLECAKQSLFALAEYASAKGAVIAVEDLPRTCLGRSSSDILSLLSAHPALRVCFDTNHLLSESIVDFIKAVGDKIITTHVSDYDFVNERHWLPGEGKINWIQLRDALISVGYDGYWLYELGLSGSDWTIDRPRDLTHEDFSRNFNEIMSGTPPTPVGTAKPALPMFRP